MPDGYLGTIERLAVDLCERTQALEATRVSLALERRRGVPKERLVETTTVPLMRLAAAAVCNLKGSVTASSQASKKYPYMVSLLTCEKERRGSLETYLGKKLLLVPEAAGRKGLAPDVLLVIEH
jgi:hypothetical protein